MNNFERELTWEEVKLTLVNGWMKEPLNEHDELFKIRLTTKGVLIIPAGKEAIEELNKLEAISFVKVKDA